jgi:Uma2 family endonuclease
MVRDEVFFETQPETELSDYEIERNKPMPNIIHGTIQSKLSRMLGNAFDGQFIFPNELGLNTTPPSTPDICIYPLKKLDIKNVQAKESIPPLTTIEILSPSQSINELAHKAWDLYFPLGVKSSWIVVPEFKAIHIMLPGDVNLYFDKGILKDPATGIELEVEKVFEDLI